MTKMKATKRALLSSALALFLCCAMLIGTTFAWFTDEVKSANNIITAGNLDIELEYAKLDADGNLTAWKPVKGASEIFDPEALWEPGRVEIAYLKVSNLGSLALKYQLGVNVYDEKPGTNVAGEEFKLSEFLVFKVVEMPDGLTTFATREDAIAAAGTTMGLKDYNGVTTPLEVEGVDYVALIVYMPETVDNKANYRGTDIPTITLGINLYATQLASEEDSFGSDYDEDAWGEGFKVTTAGDLQSAINNGVTNIVLTNDITLSESIVIPAPGATTVNVATTAKANTNAVVIDLNGKKITTAYNESTGKHAYALDNYGSLVIKGGTIEARGIYNRDGATITVNETKIVNLDMNGGSCIWSYGGSVYLNNATLIGYTGCVYSEGYLEINGGTYTCYSAITDDGEQITPTYNIRSSGELVINEGDFTSRHGLLAIEGAAEINGGTYTMTSIGVITSHVFYAHGDSADIVVNDGTFNCDLRTAQNNGSSMICDNAVKSTISVFGGTYNLTPEKYLADGLKAVADQNGVYRVISENASLIYTADALKEALANGGEYVLSANIAAGDTTFTVAAGKEAVLDLNGFTISGTDNLTASYGLINVGAGADLTINDSIGTGKIVCSATNNRGWNAYSSVVSNQRGTLTVNGGTIEHLGGTDMAYAIDNLTNGKGTYAETVINGGTLKSTYIGIRQFCNGTEAQNIVEINGGVIEGGKRSVWMQNPNANANTGSLTVKGGTLIGEMTIGSDAFDVTVNGGTFTDLQNALNYATNGAVINMAADFTGDVTVSQKPDVKITIDGNGKTFAGVITVDGKSATYTTAGLTIKNVNFKADSISADACIRLGAGTNATRYTCNVTVDGCTFDVPGAVGVKSYTGGDKNLTIKNSTATANAHSLVQAKGIDGILVEKCVVNSKNGLNFNNSTNVTIDGCTVDVKGYAVRFGEGTAATGDAETYVIKNCTLKSANDDGDATIVLRGSADKATLTIENTTIVGTPDIANNAIGATIVK